MTKTRRQLKAEIDGFTTYNDVLVAALALTSLKKFSINNWDWQRAIYQICLHQGDIPELREISFVERPPLVSSNEAYQFISWLFMSHQLEDRRIFYVMPSRMRKAIQKKSEALLTKYPQIRAMAKVFDRHLVLKL